jgi:hypothetical protein
VITRNCSHRRRTVRRGTRPGAPLGAVSSALAKCIGWSGAGPRRFERIDRSAARTKLSTLISTKYFQLGA